MNQLEFLNDALNKCDRQVAGLIAERDRWRSLLVRVVGEINAERMFRDQSISND